MRNLRAILIGILVGATLSIGHPQTPIQHANTQAGPNYPNSEEGFRAQIKGLARAPCSKDKTEEARLLEQFRLADSQAWFSQNFDPSEAPKLADRYDRVFPKYVGSLEGTLDDMCKAKGSVLLISPADEPREQLPSVLTHFKLSAIHPARELSLSRFNFNIQFGSKSAGSWEDTFVYENGSFRFIGAGARPFWIWEEDSGPGFWKTNFMVQPELIHQVSPEYPREARAKHIEGVVTLLVTVDKDGKVTKVDVVKGDPLLIGAAVEAVKRWRFKPVPAGGDPIEAKTAVNFAFQLPKR